MSLAEALERAASALPELEDAIRPANGDPGRLLEALDAGQGAHVLAFLLSDDPASGEELALAWGELEGGRAPLAALDAGALDKTGRKAWRRVSHRLRSRGVELPAAAPRPVVATLRRVEDDFTTALLTPMDGSGAQLAVLVEPHPSGGARIFEAVIDDERGILEFHAAATTRSEARKLLRELGGRARFAAMEAPPEAVRARLARVAGAHPADRALPRGFTEWRARAAEAAPDAQTPGELARAALPTAPEPELLSRAVEWVRAGEVGPWPPATEALRSCAERLHEASRSAIVVNEAQRRERVDAAFGELLEERFAGEGGERAATRWEETGYARWKQGREDEARTCLAAAAAFREGAPRENPVARALLERALAPVFEALREEEESSLVVKPGQEKSSLVVKP